MTYDNLQSMNKQLLQEYNKILLDRSGGDSILQDEVSTLEKQKDCNDILARACIRRIAYRYLDKYAKLFSSPDVVEDALNYYKLPNELQQHIGEKYGHKSPPSTWYEALEQLKALSTTNGSLDKGMLWRLILEHPMTAYIPVQCQKCGHVVPDQYPLQQSDEEVGIKELDPTGDELALNAGWYRGPRKAVVFQLTCPDCQHVSKWYRSGHPKVLLNPNKWGRLCGDQEDLRLTLAAYLNIPVRLVSPLDWDHVWSEYKPSLEFTTAWEVQDGSARNFCRRLDEGIGSWTRVWAVHTNPEWCQDVTSEYLRYKKDGGRADDRDDESNAEMKRYKKAVRDAQYDKTGFTTQAQTCNGYIMTLANFADDKITEELKRAAKDYGTRKWWQV